MRKRRSGHATTPTQRRRDLRINIWLLRHLQVALSSLGRLARTPLPSLMTAAVIGIALALPTGLHLLLQNLQQLSGSWDGAATISLYLQREIREERAKELMGQLGMRPDISRVRLIGREQALQEFRQLSGFGAALDTLQENPLPAVLVIEPDALHRDPQAAENLRLELQQLPEVKLAQLDLQWVQRFQAISRIAGRLVLVIGSLLAAAVLLIVVNTIRLEIQNRQAEIEITKLVGATNAFIRRPFLYLGIWYGLFGGLIAWLLTSLSLWFIATPVARLTTLYDSNFQLQGMNLPTFSLLICGSTLLGLGGAWLAVGRHLSEIEPG